MSNQQELSPMKSFMQNLLQENKIEFVLSDNALTHNSHQNSVTVITSPPPSPLQDSPRWKDSSYQTTPDASSSPTFPKRRISINESNIAQVAEQVAESISSTRKNKTKKNPKKAINRKLALLNVQQRYASGCRSSASLPVRPQRRVSIEECI